VEIDIWVEITELSIATECDLLLLIAGLPKLISPSSETSTLLDFLSFADLRCPTGHAFA
jgi:hypothetical protein